MGKFSRAIKVYHDIKELEKIGAWAIEVECVPEDILKEITKETKALTISIGQEGIRISNFCLVKIFELSL